MKNGFIKGVSKMTKQEAIGASQTANVKSVMTVRAAAKNGPGIKRKLYIGLMKFLMWTCIVYDRICII